MNIPYVCLRCRRHATKLRRQVRPATFISLGQLVDNDRDHLSALGDWAAAKKESLGKDCDASSNSLLNPVRQQGYPQPPSVDKILESLFSLNPEEDSQPSITRYSRIPKPASRKIPADKDPTVDDIEVLRRMLYKEKAPLQDLWPQCKEALRSGAWKSLGKRYGSQGVTFVRQDVFGDVLLQICRGQTRKPFRRSIPSASETIRLYLMYKVLKYHWDDIFWIQIRALLEEIYQYRSISAVVLDESVSKVPHNAILLFEELLNLWEVFMEQYGMQQKAFDINLAESNEIDISRILETSMLKPSVSRQKSRSWRGLPKYEDIRSRSAHFQADISLRFLQFLPRYPSRPVNSIVGAAILTYDCFHKLVKKFPTSKKSKSVIESAQPLLSFIEHFNYKKSFKREMVARCLQKQGTPSAIVQIVMTGWKSPSRTVAKEVASVDARANPASKTVTYHNTTRKFSHIMSVISDLGRATERSDIGLAISLWQKFQTIPMLKSARNSAREQVFTRFLSTFFSLRRPELAVEVWNFIITSGDVPQRKHWQTMIVGTGKAKDITSMRQIWSNMQAAGFEPDNQSWTAWIHGLIKCGEWRLGIRALGELALLWKKAQRTTRSGSGEIDGLLPAIEPVNGAISGLVATGRTEIVPNVFKWAQLQKLPISTSTFNIMLRPAVRKDETREVDRLLSEMELHNCQPDIVTLTIIIDGLVGNANSSFHTQTLESQHAILQKLLTALQNKGLRANTHTYSTLLDGLLTPRINRTAARAVLDHMEKNQLKFSAHIYTMLMMHYFAVKPPDLPAVDSLWRRIRIENGILDSVFYDRMIKGFARTGEVEKMLFFVRQASREGKSPSWVSLLAVLKELARVQEWDFASKFVADVLDRKSGVFRNGETSLAGKQWFWNLVDELVQTGLLKMNLESVEAPLPSETAV